MAFGGSGLALVVTAAVAGRLVTPGGSGNHAVFIVPSIAPQNSGSLVTTTPSAPMVQVVPFSLVAAVAPLNRA